MFASEVKVGELYRFGDTEVILLVVVKPTWKDNFVTALPLGEAHRRQYAIDSLRALNNKKERANV